MVCSVIASVVVMGTLGFASSVFAADTKKAVKTEKAAAAKTAAVVYKLDAAASKITWIGRKVSGEHNGTLNLSSGTLKTHDGKVSGGEFTMDMNTIKDLDIESAEYRKKLEDHLISADFFDAPKHPTGKFVLKKAVAGKGPNEMTISGDLTIKGITKPVSFPATVVLTADKATAKANFKINRLEWDIKYNSGSFFDVKKLGDKMIYDDIGIGLDLVATK